MMQNGSGVPVAVAQLLALVSIKPSIITSLNGFIDCFQCFVGMVCPLRVASCTFTAQEKEADPNHKGETGSHHKPNCHFSRP